MSTPYPPPQPDDQAFPPQQPVQPAPPAYPQPTYRAPAAPQPTYAAPGAYPAPAAPPTAYPAPAYPQQGGYPQPGYGAPVPPGSQTNPMAIVALIGAFVFWPVGIICGIIALSQIKKTRQGGRGLALAGVIIGAVAAVVTIAIIAFSVAAAKDISHNVGDLGTLGNDITVQGSVISVAMWAESVKGQTGAYPTQLDAEAPATGKVNITLVNSGTDLCVQGSLGASVYHVLDNGQVTKGACG